MKKNNGPEPSRLELLDSADLDAVQYPRDWLVTDVLVERQPCVIGGPAKCLKTGLAIDLAVSLGTGTPFLGRFRVPRLRRVIVFSGESGASTIQETARRVCRAKGQDLHDCEVLWGFALPRLSLTGDRDELRDLLSRRSAEVLILDPLYLSLFAGAASAGASNLYEVGGVLGAVAELCNAAGTTLIFCHHTVKGRGGSNSGPTTLGDLAFAGIAEFARQWVLVGRTAEFAPGTGTHELVVSIGGSAGHSSRWHLRVTEGKAGKKRKWAVDVTEPVTPRVIGSGQSGDDPNQH